MKRKLLVILGGLLALGSVAHFVMAQRRPPAQGDTVAPTPSERNGVPEWSVDPAFKKDVFTFVRVRYSDSYGGYGGRYGRARWYTDAPDSDLNFSYRLQQMT